MMGRSLIPRTPSKRIAAIVLAVLTLAPAAAYIVAETSEGSPTGPPPEAQFRLTPAVATTAREFTADPSGSYAPTGTSYAWNWGDGSTASTAGAAKHQFSAPGDYLVTLTLSHPDFGSSTAGAWARVTRHEANSWEKLETEKIAANNVDAYDAVELTQKAPFGAGVKGTLVILTTGIDPRVIPVVTPSGTLNMTYVVCTATGCRSDDIANATATDGEGTQALSVLLQQVLNTTYYVVNVVSETGEVDLAALNQGLLLAADVSASVVVSALPSDAGFYDMNEGRDAYDVNAEVGRPDGYPVVPRNEMLVFWRAIAQNLARYDYGGVGQAYPVSNGFNETRELTFSDGDHSGAGEGRSGTGGYARAARGEMDDACLPLPLPGPRFDEAGTTLPRYQRWERSLKLIHDFDPTDIAHLSPNQAFTLLTATSELRDRVCLELALDHLVHSGSTIIAPAGDNAYHSDVRTPATATWDLQSVRGLAEFPQVITVGATTSDEESRKRIVLPSSAAGPTRALYGVKPDLLAPGDVPGIVLSGVGGSRAAEKYGLTETFWGDRTRGTIEHSSNAVIRDEVLRIKTSLDAPGILWSARTPLPRGPVLTADLVLPAGATASTIMRFVASEDDSLSVWNGFGIEFSGATQGRYLATSRIYRDGQDYVPEDCIGGTSVCLAGASATIPSGPIGLRIRDTGVSRTRPGDHHTYTFEITNAQGATLATLVRDAKTNGYGDVCACDNLRFFSWGNVPNLPEVLLDNVTAPGLAFIARAEYARGERLDDYFDPEIATIGVRPSTRIAATYVAAYALIESTLFSAMGHEGVELSMLVRGRLASQAQPLANVPPFVQGAGEFKMDVTAENLLLHLKDQTLNVPAIDFGLQSGSGGHAALTFQSDDYLDTSDIELETDPAKLAWYKVDSNRGMTRVSGSAAPTISFVSMPDEHPEHRHVEVALKTVPTAPGVYAAYVPARVMVSSGAPVGDPFYRTIQIPVVVDRGFSLNLDLSGADIPEEASLWLVPPLKTTGSLVWAPRVGGPSAFATAEAGRANFGVVPSAGYGVLVASDSSVQVSTTSAPASGRESTPPLTFVSASDLVYPTPSRMRLRDLDSESGYKVPVAYRFLDMQQGADITADMIAASAPLVSKHVSAPSLAPATWNERGEAARGNGHALADPLPVGQSVLGWDVTVLGRAPPTGIGSTNAEAARAAYEGYLDASDSFPYTSVAGYLDPRPYYAEGSLTSPLPSARLKTSFPLPKPLTEVHGVLYLPLDLQGGTASVRVSVPGRAIYYAIIPEGVVVPTSRHGVTWKHDGTPADDILDDIADTHTYGLLGGSGHTHAYDIEPGRDVQPKRGDAYIIPYAFHDLGDAQAQVDVSIVIEPDPTPLFGRAAGATPLAPLPGARFRLDGAALYGWSTGEIRRSNGLASGIDVGDLSRFKFATAGIDPTKVPAIYGAPFDARGDVIGELLEVYTRADASGLKTVHADSGSWTDSSNALFVRDDTLVVPEPSLQFAFGRAVRPVFDHALHPGAVTEPYGEIDTMTRASYPRDVSFRGNGLATWRIDGRALQTLAASATDGAFRIDYVPSGSQHVADFTVAEPFPDFADPTPPAGTYRDYCLLDVGALTAATVFADYAFATCYDALIDDVYAAGNESARSQSEPDFAPQTAKSGGSSGSPPPSESGDEVPTPSRAAPCLSGEDSQDQSCAVGVLSYVDSESGKYARFLLDQIGLIPSKSTENDPSIVWKGRVPSGGAVMFLNHTFTSTGAGHLSLTVDGNPTTHNLVTIEGDDAFASTDATARSDGRRFDVVDLTSFGNNDVTIRRVGSDAPTWSISSARVVQKSPSFPEPRAKDAALFEQGSGSLLNARIQSLPLGTTVRIGPAEATATKLGGTESVIQAARGFDVASDLTITGRTLLVGADDNFGSAVIRVKPGATLALSNVIVTPKDARYPWGIVVEAGGTLVATDTTFVQGGTGASDSASILTRGATELTSSRLLGGMTGVRVTGDGSLTVTDSTIARFVRGIQLTGGQASVTNSFIDGNAIGISSSAATLDVTSSLFTSNREHAIVTQDSLVALTDVTFAWNGASGPRAALTTIEGYDNGRVATHGARFIDNGRSLVARADIDMYATSVVQRDGEAIHVAPAATLRLAQSTLDSSSRILADAGSRVIVQNTTFSHSAPIECAIAGPPGSVWLDHANAASVPQACAGRVSNHAPSTPIAAETDWTTIIARPFLRETGNKVLALPSQSAARLWEVNETTRIEVPITSGEIAFAPPDRAITLDTTPNDGTILAQGWQDSALIDTTSPTANLTIEAPRAPSGFTRAGSLPVKIGGTDGAGSGIASTDISVDSVRPDDRPGLSNSRAVTGVRGDHAVLGAGGAGGLSIATGEKITLTPVLRDRAGNVGTGFVDSVLLDTTPPRAWVNAANPCGDLFGHDFYWRAHDPMVGSGLPLPNATAYRLYVSALNLSWILDLLDISVDGLAEGLIGEGSLVDSREIPSPQRVNAFIMRAIEDNLDEILSDPLEGFRLIDWIEIGAFTRDTEYLHLSSVKGINDLLNANAHLLEDAANAIWAQKEITDEAILELAAEQLAALDVAWAKNNVDATSRDLRTELRAILDDPLATVAELQAKLDAIKEALAALFPIILSVKIEAVDDVGNVGIGIAPVLSDVFDPTSLLYFLGDNLRERVVALLLQPEIRVNLNDLHGEIRFLDPDCGLQSVDVLSKLPSEIDFANVATVYPREGQVAFDLGAIQDMYSVNDCGFRNIQFRAKDVFGKNITINATTLLDRLAPLTSLTSWNTQPWLVNAPILPLPTTLPPGWLGLSDLHVLGESTSLNIPGIDDLCRDIVSALHEVIAEAQVLSEPWVQLAKKHYGGVVNSDVIENGTVTFDEIVSVNGAKLGKSEAELSGNIVTVRLRGIDENGNEEENSTASFAFRYDRVPPVCELGSIAAQGGFTLPASWNAHDENQQIPGIAVQSNLVIAPQGNDVDWSFFATLPTVSGTSSATRDSDLPLPDFIAEAESAIWHNVKVACAVFDAAGNLGIGEALDTSLDLELPNVDWSPDPPAYASAKAVLSWIVNETVSGIDRVLVYTGDGGADRTLILETSADTGNISLDPATSTLVDGSHVEVTVVAHDNVGNEFTRTHDLIFDMTTPVGDLVTLASDLVLGYIPGAPYSFTPVITDDAGPGGEKSPLNVWMTVQELASEVVTSLNPDESGAFTFTGLADGTYTATLHVCDGAENCQDPLPASVVFKKDTNLPTATLDSIASNVEETLAPTPIGVPLAWTTGTPEFVITVTDEVVNELASGIPESGGLVAYAQEIDPATGAADANGFRIRLDEGDGIAAANSRVYTVHMKIGESIPANRLFRIETESKDRVGNVNPEIHTTRYFAFDDSDPLTTLSPASLPRYLAKGAITIAGQVDDQSAGTVNSGLKEVVLEITRTIGTDPAPIAYTYTGETLLAIALDYSIPASDDGNTLTMCAYARDRAGNVGPCSPTLTTLLDLTPPSAIIVPPADASGLIDPVTGLPDIYSRGTTISAKIRITNEIPAPGRDAAPLDTAFAQHLIGGTHYAHEPFNLDQLGLSPAAGGSIELDLNAFAAADGSIHDYRAYVGDAVGNAQVLGSTDSTKSHRTFGERVMYSFDAPGSWQTDDSGNGHTLASYGSPTAVDAPYGKALKLNGNQYATVTRSGTWLNGITPFTLMTWVNPTDTSGFRPLVTKPYAELNWGLWLDNGYPMAIIGNKFVRASEPIPTNEWHHVAMTYNGAEIVIYIDAQPVGSTPRSGSFSDSYTQLYVGVGSLRWPFGSGSYTSYRFAGQLDEIRLMNNAFATHHIRDRAFGPYELAFGPESARIHVDRTNPVAHATGGAIATGDVGVHARDVGPGTPSDIKQVTLQKRVLDASAYADDGNVLTSEGVLEASQKFSSIPEFEFVEISRTISLPPASPTFMYPRTLAVEAVIGDSIAGAGTGGASAANPGTETCDPNQSLAGIVNWQIHVNGANILNGDPAADGTLDQLRTSVSTVSAPDRVLPVKLVVHDINGKWDSCFPKLSVRFDDVRIYDAVTQQTYFHESFNTYEDWSVLYGSNFNVNHRVSTLDLSQKTTPNVVASESWYAGNSAGWTWSSTEERDTSTSLLWTNQGDAEQNALLIQHVGSTTGTQKQVELIGKPLTPSRVSRLLVSAKQAEEVTATASLAVRTGFMLELEGGESVVFKWRDTMGTPEPTTALGRNLHFVDLTSTFTLGAAHKRFDLDVAKALDDFGLTGSKVTGMYVYFEKLAQAPVTQKANVYVYIDDVRVLKDRHSVVDLSFAFPLFGKSYTRLYVSENGVIGFSPDFDDTSSAANFADQPVVAAGWGAFTLVGLDGSFGHAIAVDQRVPEAPTIVWHVGNAANAGQDYVFGATLQRNGDIRFRYAASGVPTASGVRIGVSDGTGIHSPKAVTGSLADREFLFTPARTAWTTVTDAAYPVALGAITPADFNKRIELRAIGVDRADNMEPSGGVESIVTVDTAAPILSITPIVDPLTGGFGSTVLKVLTTAVDAGIGVDPASIKIKIREKGSSTWTEYAGLAGNGRVVTTAFVLAHRATYEIALTASDKFGNDGSDAKEFLVTIVPEPSLTFVRPLLSSLYVDDEFVGEIADATPVFTGAQLTIPGRAPAAQDDVTYTAKVDGVTVFSQTQGAGTTTPFKPVLDLAAMTPGDHELVIRAATARGSWNESSVNFTITDPLVATANFESGSTGWTFDASAGGAVSVHAGAARDGSAGVRVVGPGGTTATADATFDFGENLSAARYWAFVNARTAPTNSSMVALSLEAGSGTAFAVRVNADLTLSALSNAAWQTTGVTLLQNSWTKIEAKDFGDRVTLFVNGAITGSYTRSATGLIGAMSFSARDGVLDIDDVAVSLVEAQSRLIMRDDMSATRWVSSVSGGPLPVTAPPSGGKAMRIDSTTSAPLYGYRDLQTPSVPDYWVSVNVGDFTAGGVNPDRGCVGAGDIIRLVDNAGVRAAAVRCVGGAIEAWTGSAWESTDARLVQGAFNRFRLMMGTTQYTVFMNDVFVGEFPVGTTNAVTQFRLGGGDASLWFDDVLSQRGRVLLIDGFDGLDSKAWQVPSTSAYLNVDRSSTRKFTAGLSAHVETDGTSTGTFSRNVNFPVGSTYHVEERFFIPDLASYDEFFILLLDSPTGPVFGLGLTTNVAGIHSFGYYKSATTPWVSSGVSVGAGWHYLRFEIDQANAMQVKIYLDEALLTTQPIANTALTGIGFGDINGSGTKGKGEIWLDDIIVMSTNAPPTVAIASPSASQSLPRGIITVSGSTTDNDFGDAVERLELSIDGGAFFEIPNALAWSWSWDASSASVGAHKIEARAFQAGGALPPVRRDFTLT